MNQLVKNKVKQFLSEKRYFHSLAVADTAQKLAVLWKSDPEKAYLTGLLHDIGKELSLSEMQDYLFDTSLLPEESVSKDLLNVKFGAKMAGENFEVDDPEI